MTQTSATLPQNPTALVMVRPLYFGVNPETAADNHFQGAGAATDRATAIAEFDAMVAALRAAGVTVHVFDQARADTPDAVFPNNWLSTHHDGTIITYPMYVPSRRRERRADIIAALKEQYTVSALSDLSPHEEAGSILEGTGAIVFDHAARIAYMARSQRADDGLLGRLCGDRGYTPFIFDAVDAAGRPIYHTNVMMGIGQEAAIISLETITDERVRADLHAAMLAQGRLVISLTQDQVAEFAGNTLEVTGKDGPLLALSRRAWHALTPDQQAALEHRLPVLHVDLPTIEKSGGSARCMMAGVHLPAKG